MSVSAKTVRIGCGAGFWGDTPEGPAQLVRAGNIDYLVMDYLAEITMSILARMKAKNPQAGYATDFVGLVMKPLAREIKEKGIRVVANAGGVNPEACRDALQAVFAEQGVDLKVALVRGDDLSGAVERFRDEGVTEMFSGRPMPESLASVNAYLGAFPIAAALDAGADIVLTGRCVDSALVLGPLIHEFGWTPTDHDLLSAGSLAGHVLECGAQTTGGIFTDWRSVEGWDRMGFPIAECRADGGFEVTKPEGTGGLVTRDTVAEQVVYEVGDPAAYVLPDVTCDWSGVVQEETGPDRVRVSGARGRAPTRSYKVSATYADGYRAAITMMIAGREAADKARAVGEAILSRSRRLMAEAGFADFSETSIEVLGAESSYGAQSRMRASREVILKLGVRHARKEALAVFAREIYPSATAMAQGITGFAGGRPEPQPVIRLFSFLVDKAGVPVEVEVEGRTIRVGDADAGSAGSDAGSASSEASRSVAPPPLTPPHKGEGDSGTPTPPSPLWGGVRGGGNVAPATTGHAVSGGGDVARAAPGQAEGGGGNVAAATTGQTVTVPLIALAHGRSGDKGDFANIGVLARRPDFVAPIRAAVTPEAVRHYMAHFVRGKVERFEWPGLDGFNFLLHEALGGGGIASLRHDPQGKAFAQILLDLPVPVPAAWVAPGGPLADWAGEARPA